MSENARYVEAIGRRKTSTARVRVVEAAKQTFTVNEKELKDYFQLADLQNIALQSIQEAAMPTKFKVTAKVSGGGIHSQAEAVRHALGRIMVAIDPILRKKLKDEGLLKRDPRAKERRKFGLKKARKAPQWSKR